MKEALQPFQTVRDLLQRVGELHDQGRSRFAAAADATDDVRLKVVLSFLEQQEREQLRAVARLSAGDDAMLDSYVQSVPADTFEAACRTPLPTDAATEALDGYGRREQALEHCFAQLRDGVGPRAAQVFEALQAMKQQHQARLREASLDV